MVNRVLENTSVELSTADNSVEESKILIPVWLTNQLLEKHLQQFFDDKKLKVISFQAKPAIGENANFISFIYRLTVSLNKVPGNHLGPELSVIAKIGRSDGSEFDLLSEMGVFDREMDFFDLIAPKMKKYLQQLGATESIRIPDSYGVCRENGVIFLEDLKTKNYCNKSIREGFTVDEAKLILKNLAAFHAVGSMLHQDQSDIFDNFQEGLVNRSAKGFNFYYLTQFDGLVETISLWPEFAQYAEKLKRLRGRLIETLRKTFLPNPKHFNTCCHGDMWGNNIMVTYADESEATIKNIILLDFQFTCWNSPAIDLQYFFGTSLHDSIQQDGRNELFEFYFELLLKNVKELNFKGYIPTLEEFKSQYDDKIFWSFTATCVIKPTFINECKQSPDFETMFLNNEKSADFAREVYSSQKTRAGLRKYIPYFDKLGIFD